MIDDCPRLLCPESDRDAASSTTTSNEDVSQSEHSLITWPKLNFTEMLVLKYFSFYHKTILDVKFCEGGPLVGSL